MEYFENNFTAPPKSDKVVMWRFLRNRLLILRLHKPTIFRALIYWAHRAVILAITWFPCSDWATKVIHWATCRPITMLKNTLSCDTVLRSQGLMLSRSRYTVNIIYIRRVTQFSTSQQIRKQRESTVSLKSSASKQLLLQQKP